jgi:hypothetical protein
MSLQDIIERAFEQAFSKALDQTLQNKAEALFKKAFENGSPLAKKLEEKIDQGFQKFIEDGIHWEKESRGSRNSANGHAPGNETSSWTRTLSI